MTGLTRVALTAPILCLKENMNDFITMYFDAHEMQSRFLRNTCDRMFDRLERMEEDLSQALNSVSLEQKDSKMDTFG